MIMNTGLAVILGMVYGFLPFPIRRCSCLLTARSPTQRRARPVRLRPDAFLRVTLPLTMPGITAAGLLTFIQPRRLRHAGHARRSQATTIAKIVQEHLHWLVVLVLRRRARVPPDGVTLAGTLVLPPTRESSSQREEHAVAD